MAGSRKDLMVLIRFALEAREIDIREANAKIENRNSKTSVHTASRDSKQDPKIAENGPLAFRSKRLSKSLLTSRSRINLKGQDFGDPLVNERIASIPL